MAAGRFRARKCDSPHHFTASAPSRRRRRRGTRHRALQPRGDAAATEGAPEKARGESPRDRRSAPCPDSGGEAGIRTLGTLAGSPVFETGPFDHSGTSPCGGPQSNASHCRGQRPRRGVFDPRRPRDPARNNTRYFRNPPVAALGPPAAHGLRSVLGSQPGCGLSGAAHRSLPWRSAARWDPPLDRDARPPFGTLPAGRNGFFPRRKP